ncbi:hypothetical protein, partial [Sansalvadorimonas verongulae]|uniref:hypothetical protein n=1 Tax=Sansalvadorimonas verongulae TaxID=2172824 RepID=UPI001E577BC7
GEMTGLGERLIALATDKGPAPCVGALMFGEIVGCGKCFVAPVLITDKRSVHCVGVFVGGDCPRLGERLTAPVLVTGPHEIFFYIKSCRVHAGDIHGLQIAVRLNLTHFSKNAICIECALPCTGAKNT